MFARFHSAIGIFKQMNFLPIIEAKREGKILAPEQIGRAHV